MSKLIEFVVNGGVYTINGSYGDELTGIPFSPENIDSVELNGEQVNNFGETWVGTAIDEYEFLAMAVSNYFNDNQSIDFIEVCDEIKNFKDEHQSYSYELDGRKIPDIVITSSGSVCELVAFSRSCAYYYDEDAMEDAIASIVTREDGSVATNIEKSFMLSLMEEYEKSQLIYMTEDVKAFLSGDFNEDDYGRKQQEAYKKFKEWMKKPCDKVAKEIEKL